MNGWLTLPALRGCSYTVYGGPYRAIPMGMFGVKLTTDKENPMNADIKIGVKDFSTPDPVQLIAAVSKVVEELRKGTPVYVGCGAGIGRTGTFLSVLAKAWGIPDPVSHVREVYLSSAVETDAQVELVSTIKIPWGLRLKVLLAKMEGLFSREQMLTDLSGVDTRALRKNAQPSFGTW